MATVGAKSKGGRPRKIEEPAEPSAEDLAALRFRCEGFTKTAQGLDPEGRCVSEGGLTRREAIGMIADLEWLIDRCEYLEAVVKRLKYRK